MPRLPFLRSIPGTGRRLGFLASSASAAPIAVDYGRRSIRMLQASRGSHGYACTAAEELPGWVLAANDDENIGNALAESLRKIVSKCGFVGNTCSLVLPAELFQSDTARLPVMSDAELKQSIEFEATDRFGVDKATTSLGYIRLGQPLAGQQDVLIMAAPRTAVDAAVRPARSAGLGAVHLEHAAFAALRTIARQRRAEIVDETEAANFAMVHLEDRIATLVVVHEGTPTMVRSVLGDWAPERMTAARSAVRSPGQRAQPAAPARVPSSGDTAISIDGEEPQGAPEAQTQANWRWCSLAEETLRCLRHLERTLNGWWPSKLVITGPSACDPQVVASMESVCAVHAELAVPIRLLDNPAPCIHGNRWVATIGTAIAELPAVNASKSSAESGTKGSTPVAPALKPVPSRTPEGAAA